MSSFHLHVHLNTLKLVNYMLFINSIWTSISCSFVDVKLLTNGGVYGFLFYQGPRDLEHYSLEPSEFVISFG